MKLSRPTLTAAVFVVIGLVALALQHVVVPYTQPFWGLFDNQLDLDVYRAGAQVVLDGGSLYDAKLLGQMDYTYAPISIPFFVPFAWMSFEVARIVWCAGIILALYAVIMRSFVSLGRETSWQLRVIALSLVAVMMLIEPVRTTIWYGQINIFLLWLIVADLTRPESARWRGVGTGIAAGIKLTPLIFVLYLGLIRSWRAAAGVLAGFLGTMIVGFLLLPNESWQYWTGKLFDSDRVGAPQTVGNQSIRGWLANLIRTDEPNSILWFALALAALALGMYAAVLAHRHGQELLAITLVGLTSTSVSPMSWGHHWVWFVPLLVIAIHLLLRTDLSAVRRGLVGVGLIAVFLIAFSWRTYLAYPIWFVNKTVPDAYLIGLFFKNGIVWLKWFTYYPYGYVFLGACLATIVVYRPWAPRVVDDRFPRSITG